MPEPGMDVLKYWVLRINQYMRPSVVVFACVPVDCAIVLAPRCILSAQFHARKHSLLAPNAAYKLDNTHHAAGDVDHVADVDVAAICAHSGGCGRSVAPY